MTLGFLRISRKALAALALLAAMLSVLAPVCRMWHFDAAAPAMASSAASLHAGLHAAQAPGAVAQCCPYEGGDVAMAAQALVAGSADSQPLAPAMILVVAAAFALVVRHARPRLPIARTPQSFYLRSARILR